MKKKTAVLLALALALAILPCAFAAAAGGAEEIPVDTRIAVLSTEYECGCTHSTGGVMIGRNGLLTTSTAFYCPVHGKKYTNVVFEFGRLENGLSAVQYTGEFYVHAYEEFPYGYNRENDIAYVRFPELIGDETGWYDCIAPETMTDLRRATLVIRTNDEGTGFREETASYYQIMSDKFLRIAFTGENLIGTPVFLIREDGESPVIGVINSKDGDAWMIRRITARVDNDMFADKMYKEGDASCEPVVTSLLREGTAQPAAEEPEENAPETEAAETEETETEAAGDGLWNCPDCGREANDDNFCPHCGRKRP